MRGFSKAAALLSSTFLISASGFVIPDSGSPSVDNSRTLVDLVEHRESYYFRNCHRELTKEQVPQRL